MPNKTRSLAYTAVFFALAMALSYAESALALFLLLPPGVKLGLANVVVMYCFLLVGKRYALALVVLKSAFAFLTRGAIAATLSVCGGTLSFVTLLLLVSALRMRKSYFIVSASSAIAHNIGQLAALSIFFSSAYTLYYLPVLLLSGLAMGFLTSITLRTLIAAIAKH